MALYLEVPTFNVFKSSTDFNAMNAMLNKIKAKISKGTGAEIVKVLFIRIFGICATYITMYLVIRWGSVRDWGWINLTISVVNILGIITTFGLHTLILKRFPINTSAENRRDVSAIFRIIAVLSIVMMLILLPFKDFFYFKVFKVEYSYPFWMYMCLLLLIPVFNFQKIILSVFRINKQMVLFGLFNGNNIYFFALAVVASVLVLLFQQIDTSIILSMLFVVPVVAILWAAYLALKKLEGFNVSDLWVKHPKSRYKGIMLESTPLVLSSSLMMLMSWSDTFLIGYFMNPEAVGYYNIIFKISSIATIFLSVVNAVVTPQLSLLYKQDKAKLGRFVRASNKYVFISTSAVLLVVMVFSDTILGLFGDGIGFLKTPLLILIVGYFINAYCGTIGYLLQMTGYAKVFQNIVLIATISNISLNILLIPKFGILGAAISGTITMAFWNIAGTYIVNKKLKINTFFLSND